jgi:MFS family permease
MPDEPPCRHFRDPAALAAVLDEMRARHGRSYEALADDMVGQLRAYFAREFGLSRAPSRFAGARDPLVRERFLFGLSGGVDSSVVAFLAVRAVGPAAVLPVTMPAHPDDESVAMAALCRAALGLDEPGAPYVIDVRPVVDAYLRAAAATGAPRLHLGEAQATQSREQRMRLGNFGSRVRVGVLYDLQRAARGRVLGTGNRTEFCQGYSTKFGTPISYDYGVLDELYKVDVQGLARARRARGDPRGRAVHGLLSRPDPRGRARRDARRARRLRLPALRARVERAPGGRALRRRRGLRQRHATALGRLRAQARPQLRPGARARLRPTPARPRRSAPRGARGLTRAAARPPPLAGARFPASAVRGRSARRGGPATFMTTFDSTLARGLVADPTWRRWALVAALVRLPSVMAPFALLLAGRAATGEFAHGAWLVSAHALGAAAAAPARGRALDRAGSPGALRRVSAYQALLLAALGGAAAARAPLAPLLALALVAGVVPAGCLGGVRALLPAVASGPRLESAFALDAVMFELLWIAGPLLVGACASFDAPLAAVGVMGASALGAWALGGRLPPGVAPAGDAPPRGGLWRSPGVASVLVVSLSFGVGWGALEAGLPPRLEQLGARAALWGALSAALAATSACGGLLYALAPRRGGARDARRRVRLFVAAWACLLAPLAWARGTAALAACLAGAGFVIAPLSAQLNALLERALPPARRAEGFAAYGACWSGGIAAGTALAGATLGRFGPAPLLVLAPLLPLVATFAAVRAGRDGASPHYE